jgi:hypothetical protein
MNMSNVKGMIESLMLPGETVAHQTVVDTSLGVWFAFVLTDQAVYWFPSAGPWLSLADSRKVDRLPLNSITEVALVPQKTLSRTQVTTAFAIVGGLLSFWMWKSMGVSIAVDAACTVGVIVVGLAISVFTSRSNPAIRRLCIKTGGKKAYIFNPYLVAQNATAELQQQCISAQELVHAAMQRAGLVQPS